MPLRPIFFATEADFRDWLDANHETAPELLVGFWKKDTGKASIDWPQARDQALCFGWIDGIRKSMGDDAYTIRFTPRRPKSIWSKVNLERFDALKAAGLMTPAGEEALKNSTGPKGIYAYEKPVASLSAAEQKEIRGNKAAWGYWQGAALSYRRSVLNWITTAKKPETRAKRLAILIECSAKGERIPGYDWRKKP